MILWTIQDVTVWHTLQRTGMLYGASPYVNDYFLPAYRWMCRQMQQRIGPPRAPDASPLWAWYQWDNTKKRKPDLRFTGYLPRGTTGVRIEIEVADHRLLLSDFELWHYVLNDWYLPLSEEDDQRFEEEATTMPAPVRRERITASWQRIFDLDWEEPYCTRKREEKAIQATLWEIYLSNVRNAQEFVAR